jgi:hypothetical protein
MERVMLDNGLRLCDFRHRATSRRRQRSAFGLKMKDDIFSHLGVKTQKGHDSI